MKKILLYVGMTLSAVVIASVVVAAGSFALDKTTTGADKSETVKTCPMKDSGLCNGLCSGKDGCGGCSATTIGKGCGCKK